MNREPITVKELIERLQNAIKAGFTTNEAIVVISEAPKFHSEDTVFLIKIKDKDRYLTENENGDLSFCDNIMEARYYSSRELAEFVIKDNTWFEDTKDDYEIIKIKYEFYWTYVEE